MSDNLIKDEKETWGNRKWYLGRRMLRIPWTEYIGTKNTSEKWKQKWPIPILRIKKKGTLEMSCTHNRERDLEKYDGHGTYWWHEEQTKVESNQHNDRV